MEDESQSIPSERYPFTTAKQFIRSPCVPLIGIFTTDNNENLHRLIVQGVPKVHVLAFLASQYTHVFPPKPSGDAVMVNRSEGIIANEWFAQYQRRLAAVAVLLFEYSLDKEEFEDRVLKTVKMFKELNSSRVDQVKIMVLVVIPSTYDSAEVKEICYGLVKKAELESRRCAFVLNLGNQKEDLANLESSLWFLALDFYHNLCKVMNTNLESLELNEQQMSLMKCRINFKIGYFHQVCGEIENAISHFRKSYEFLLKLPITSSSSYEIKNFGYLVTFMTLKLFLQQGKPENFQEAVNTFFKFIEQFENEKGYPDIVFRHWSWLQHQFALFAEMLEYYHSPLNDRFHNSAYYYHRAAEYAKLRMLSYKKESNV
jgi:tetratricopeptide (TPR) repeat protein